MSTAKIAINSFTSYDLQDSDILQGCIFTDLQIMILRNERAVYAEQKLSLDFDPLNPVEFAQQEAALKGKLELLTYLIERSEESNNILNNPNYTTE